MTRMVVTSAEAEAARLLVKRARARGEMVSEPIRKIAAAKRFSASQNGETAPEDGAASAVGREKV